MNEMDNDVVRVFRGKKDKSSCPGGVVELKELAEEIIHLAEKITCTSHPERVAAGKGSKPNRGQLLLLSRFVYDQRRMRKQYFPDELFGEPAWDILLDLFIAAQAGEQRLVKQACLAAQVPSTTALRYIAALEGAGLIERANDSLDRRRTFIFLTRRGLEKMVKYFLSMADLTALDSD